MIHEFCISEVSFLNVAPVQGAVVLVLCPNCTGLSDFALPMVPLIDLGERVNASRGMQDEEEVASSAHDSSRGQKLDGCS